MKLNHWIFKGVLALSGAGAAGLLVGCGDDASAMEGVEKAPLVAVETVKTGPGFQGLELSGQLRAEHETHLGFRVAGKVAERVVMAGQRVKAGDLLYTLDAADYGLQLKAMQAQESVAQARFKDADDQLGHNQRLLDQAYISQAQFDRVKAAWEQAKAALDAAASARENAENSLDYTQLKAEEDGIVLEVLADEGQVVPAGQPVVVIADSSRIEAEVYLPERYVDAVKVGDEVSMSPTFDHGSVMEGSVREIAGTADARTRTYRTRISLDDSESVNRLGGSVVVKLELPLAKPGVLVEPDALCGESEGQIFVWILQSGSQVERRDIDVLGALGGEFVIDGVEAGEQVVTRGARFLRHATEVRVYQESGNAQ